MLVWDGGVLDQFAGESDDEDDEQGKWGRDDKDGSGNDKPNRESEGEATSTLVHGERESHLS